ncbi:DNA translocase FtsK [Pontibacillus halophilus]|nr:DNA translocase FtsK [Pontibacillus halophilus]
MKKWFRQLSEEERETANKYSDNDAEEGQYHKKSNDSSFDTKMAYQYPKERAFRFPVIPDENLEQRTTYSREERLQRKTSYNSRQTEQRYSYKQNREEDYEYEESKSSNSWNEKEEQEPHFSRPFTPSEVPSPIYGFGKREDRIRVSDLDDVPAYLRKLAEKQQQEEVEPEPSKEQDSEGFELLQQETDEDVHTRDLVNEADVEEEENVVNLFVHEESEMVDQEETHIDENQQGEVSTEDEDLGEDIEAESTSSPVFFDEDMISPHWKREDRLEFEDDEQSDSSSGQGLSLELDMDDEEEETEGEPAVDDTVESTEHPAHEHEEEFEQEVDEFLSNDTDDVFPAEQEELDESNQSTPVTESKGNVKQEETVEEMETARPEPTRSRRPFNVMMTPMDKRNRDRDRKAKDEQQMSSEPVQVQQEEESLSDADDEHEPKVAPKDKTVSVPVHLLEDMPPRNEDDAEWIEAQKDLLETTLKHFHVKASVVHATKGPSVTRFEVQPEPGVKVSKITNLADDIKLNMAAKDIRMEAPIPGKNAIGIEVPNKTPEAVSLQEIFESDAFKSATSPLSVGLGLDISGEPIVTDLRKMPHGLIAGATGSGKSVNINTILISLLYKAHHEDVKFLLIDPKMVELAPYNDLPHLVAPVINDVKAATSALKWAVNEMEERYEKFVKEGARNIDGYNEKMKKQGRPDAHMPYLVIVIDELADLMMMSPQDVEDAICRIAQKARACGIHLLVATQRPSVDVITGLIKANIPTRMAFSVSSQVDSRTIIDTSGAEKLLGRGDMLFLENGSGKTQRIQGAFVSDEEIERITSYVKKIAPPNYVFEQDELILQTDFEEEDDLFDAAVEFVIQQSGASASLLQRRFKVGYNRAARLIDTMEEKGIISGPKGSKPRDVYVSLSEFEELRQATSAK